MKVIPFKVPRSPEEAFRVQVDQVPHLYNHLHQHPEIQIMLIQKSEGTLIAGDYMGRFAPGDVFIISSNQPHVFRNDEKYFTGAFEALTISIYFDDHSLGKDFWKQPELKSIQQFMHRSSGFRVYGTKQVLIKRQVQELVNATGIFRIIGFLEILSCFCTPEELSPLALPSEAGYTKTYDTRRLNNILEFTFRESHRAIYLPEVAAQANMTTEAFCKYFKTRTRKTYINFLNEIRINNACRLLMDPDKTVEEIAYETGFANLSHFNRQFKKVTETSPLQFRKRLL